MNRRHLYRTYIKYCLISIVIERYYVYKKKDAFLMVVVMVPLLAVFTTTAACAAIGTSVAAPLGFAINLLYGLGTDLFFFIFY